MIGCSGERVMDVLEMPGVAGTYADEEEGEARRGLRYWSINVTIMAKCTKRPTAVRAVKKRP